MEIMDDQPLAMRSAILDDLPLPDILGHSRQVLDIRFIFFEMPAP